MSKLTIDRIGFSLAESPETVDEARADGKVGGDRHSRRARVAVAERERLVFEAWLKGATASAAARQVGLQDSAGRKIVKRLLRRIAVPDKDEATKAALERHQRLRLMATQASAMDPIRAVHALIRIEEREAKLLGLDAPTKSEVSGSQGGPITIEALRQAMEAEMERRGIKE